MPEIVDLSHALTDEPTCTHSVVDKIPSVTFEEGEAHGMFFVTSHIDNLSLNLATHIDFPGHLPQLDLDARPTGEYPLNHFIGPAAVLDFRYKFDVLRRFFTPAGVLSIDGSSDADILDFLDALDSLKISRVEFESALRAAGASLDDLSGVILVTGASEFWKHATFDSWQYIYFYGPYMAADACELICEAGITFVGIDSFQLEHPIINFRGDELPVVVHASARERVAQRLESHRELDNHTAFLGSDILIYENLNVPSDLCGEVAEFHGVPLNWQIPGVTDNALARPYLVR